MFSKTASLLTTAGSSIDSVVGSEVLVLVSVECVFCVLDLFVTKLWVYFASPKWLAVNHDCLLWILQSVFLLFLTSPLLWLWYGDDALLVNSYCLI